MAADFGISIAEKLIETIGSAVIKEVCDMWGYKTQLEELTETVSTIQKVLLDADNKRELSSSEQLYINNLKDALYDADDLFDEVRTLAELNQLRPRSKRGKLFEKMNVEKLKKMVGAVRIGGKGSMRRKKKVVHKTTTTDDKRLQSTLKRIGVNAIPAIEEVNIFKDDQVIQFINPKVQASIAANTWVVSGSPQTKSMDNLFF